MLLFCVVADGLGRDDAADVLACGTEDFDTAFLVFFLTVAFLTAFTVVLQVYFFFPTLAVILTVPVFTPFTMPFAETVATFLFDVDHFTFPLTPVSFNVFVLPI